MREFLEYVPFVIVRTLVRVVPMRVVRASGRALGRLAYLMSGSRRRTAVKNLAAAFPGRPASEHRAVAQAMFGHFGSMLLELVKFGTYSPQRMLQASEVEGEERVWNALQQGRGVLLLSGHFGYWEMQGVAHGVRFNPVSLLARPLDNPKLHRALERIRTSTGNTVIYRQGAVRKMLRDLASNRGIALLIDQHLHSPDAIFIDFFQRPAATSSMLAEIALRTGAPVIPVFALPLPRGRYRFIYEHPVEPPRPDSPDAVREFTQRCTDVLEMYVRRHPELWLWMHRRWREQPNASASEALEDRSDAEADV
jgi:KDO2-lipid IV(A) lauroyltransferase